MGCSSSARSRPQEPPQLPGETGEQVETELLSETVSEGPETKEEETGEAVDSAAATEIVSDCPSLWRAAVYSLSCHRNHKEGYDGLYRPMLNSARHKNTAAAT
uniref:glutamate-rich protein 5 n=1 Tax=Agelaius phoeniceus TaxID=39638 RepID=UPI0023EB341F|nr:glutamate-rich protein 5 [Agelaius phoeniceus]